MFVGTRHFSEVRRRRGCGRGRSASHPYVELILDLVADLYCLSSVGTFRVGRKEDHVITRVGLHFYYNGLTVRVGRIANISDKLDGGVNSFDFKERFKIIPARLCPAYRSVTSWLLVRLRLEYSVEVNSVEPKLCAATIKLPAPCACACVRVVSHCVCSVEYGARPRAP